MAKRRSKKSLAQAVFDVTAAVETLNQALDALRGHEAMTCHLAPVVEDPENPVPRVLCRIDERPRP